MWRAGELEREVVRFYSQVTVFTLRLTRLCPLSHEGPEKITTFASLGWELKSLTWWGFEPGTLWSGVRRRYHYAMPAGLVNLNH